LRSLNKYIERGNSELYNSQTIVNDFLDAFQKLSSNQICPSWRSFTSDACRHIHGKEVKKSSSEIFIEITAKLMRKCRENFTPECSGQVAAPLRTTLLRSLFLVFKIFLTS
jgi:hypothetical protein